MQQLLSLAVLFGAMLHLQGCGGGDATTAAPETTDTTAAPSTATPTVAPVVLTGGFKLDGMTKDQAEAVKPAMEEGIATGFGLPASAVTITSITEATRRLDDRALTSHASTSTSLQIAFEATVPADKVAAVTTAAAAAVTDSSALLAAVKAAVEASDAPAEVKAAMAAATVSGLVATLPDPVDSSNSTRRLSFSFVTSDEPLIL